MDIGTERYILSSWVTSKVTGYELEITEVQYSVGAHHIHPNWTYQVFYPTVTVGFFFQGLSN